MEQFISTLLEKGHVALCTAGELLGTLGEAAIELGAQGFATLKEKTACLIESGGEKLEELTADRKRAIAVAVAVGTAVLAVCTGLILLLRRKK